MTFAHGEQVMVVRAYRVLDAYSGEVTALDWSAATRRVVPGCGIEPASSGVSGAEPLRDSRTQVNGSVNVYAPYGTDIAALDRLIIRGTTWDVDGDPAVWRHPMTGWEPGIVVRATKVAG